MAYQTAVITMKRVCTWVVKDDLIPVHLADIINGTKSVEAALGKKGGLQIIHSQEWGRVPRH